MYPLPVEVERRIVPLPPVYPRVSIDSSVVVYSTRMHVLVDVVAIVRP
jgi:hypothetical protein